ncbi:MAG: hypothetical protein JO327_09360 [Nitrososphaeraceae archaeon]|nr:hypothetical protein [Nitrososphaeraceae archaeon]MBV9668323.1 hypothetical protein [Nitrososphaeraceae archaeon]
MTTTQVSSESRGQYKTKAYAAAGAKSPLAPITISRRDPAIALSAKMVSSNSVRT